MCLRSCFLVQGEFDWEIIYEAIFLLYQIQKNPTNPTLLNGTLEKGTNKKVLARAGSLVDKIMYYP